MICSACNALDLTTQTRLVDGKPTQLCYQCYAPIRRAQREAREREAVAAAQFVQSVSERVKAVIS